MKFRILKSVSIQHDRSIIKFFDDMLKRFSVFSILCSVLSIDTTLRGMKFCAKLWDKIIKYCWTVGVTTVQVQ